MNIFFGLRIVEAAIYMINLRTNSFRAAVELRPFLSRPVHTENRFMVIIGKYYFIVFRIRTGSAIRDIEILQIETGIFGRALRNGRQQFSQGSGRQDLRVFQYSAEYRPVPLKRSLLLPWFAYISQPFRQPFLPYRPL